MAYIQHIHSQKTNIALVPKTIIWTLPIHTQNMCKGALIIAQISIQLILEDTTATDFMLKIPSTAKRLAVEFVAIITITLTQHQTHYLIITVKQTRMDVTTVL